MIPLERVKVPWTGWPGTVSAGAIVQVPTVVVVPALIATGAAVRVEAAPASEQAIADAGALPVFDRVTSQCDAAARP